MPAERLIVAPDCGMKYLPREVAYGKMVSMVKGAAMVREALETARNAADKSKKKGAVPEIRTASGGAARTAARPAPKAKAKAAKAKPAAKPKAKAKKAGKKR